MFVRFAYIGLCLFSIAISVYIKGKVERFLTKNTAIANEKSLEEYKDIVRLNMYGAIAQIIIIIGAFASCVAFIFAHGVRGVFSLFLLGFAAGFGKELSQLEEKVRSLTCATPELERKYQNISHTWKKKALPDF